MDEDTQKILISIMEQLNDLEENMKTIESNINKKEKINLKEDTVINTEYIKPGKESDTEFNEEIITNKSDTKFNGEQTKSSNEYNDDFVERVENLIIAVDGILEYVQNNLDNSGLRMPIGIVRMLLDLVLNYAPNIVSAVPFKPQDICSIAGKQKTKGRGNQRKNMGCSVADLLSNFI